METLGCWINCLFSHGVTTALIVVAITIFLYWYGWKNRRMLEATFPGIPGPKPWPFLGNMPGFFRDDFQFHLFVDTSYKKYGSMFCTSFLDIPVLAISDPKMIKEVLVKQFESFHNRPQLIGLPPPLDRSLDVAEGEIWHRIRTVLSPSFSSHKLKSMVPLMNATCDTLMETMGKAAICGDSIDILRCQQSLTLDTILSAAFGVQGDYQKNPNDPLLQTAKRAMNPGPLSQALLLILPMLPFGTSFLRTGICTQLIFRDFFDLFEFSEKVIELKRNEGSNRKDFLDLMLSSQGPDVPENKKLSESEIVMQSLLFLIAGYETSSTTLGMLCYNLAVNPDIQERLQQEIDEVWTEEEKMPSYETVQELQYLDMTISETLRLCPPGNMLVRTCNKECVIEGVKIPKGCLVTIPVYSIHMDPNIYPNPEKFDPERFTPEGKQTRDPYHYLPFGSGPRNCIGMRFALMEIKLVVARLLKKFTFVPCEDTKKPYLESKPLLGPSKGVMVGIKYRNATSS